MMIPNPRVLIVAVTVAFAASNIFMEPPTFADTTGAASPSPTQSTAASPSSSGGSTPIESTLFAYQGLSYDAAEIAKAVSAKLNLNTPAQPEPAVVIGSPSDMVAIAQLRVILTQASLITERLMRLESYAHKPYKVCSYPLRNLGPRITSFVSTPSDLASLVSTITGLTAVNYALASSSGAFTDASLIILVANQIPNASIYVSSMYTPNALAVSGSPDLSGSYIGAAIDQLNGTRRKLNEDVAAAQCKDPAFLAAVAGAGASVELFYWTLFTGQSPPAVPKPDQKATDKKDKTPPNPPPVIVVPFPGVATSPVLLQQVLPADFLLHQIFNRSNPKTYFLVLHALETGGEQLTKQNSFFGSRIYLSGGAAASFALFPPDGSIICSGIAYGYRGFISVNNVSDAIKSGDASPALVGTPQLACRSRMPY